MRSSDVLAGAVAGFLATIPMTLFMLAIHRRLPRNDQHRLPPEQITGEVMRRMGLRRRLDTEDEKSIAWLLHFAFGASAGALYAAVSAPVTLPEWAKGTAYGLVVWVGSYFGWLPALEIRGHGGQQSRRRNSLMLLAHVVWGVTLGVLTHRLAAALAPPSASRSDWRA